MPPTNDVPNVAAPKRGLPNWRLWIRPTIGLVVGGLLIVLMLRQFHLSELRDQLTAVNWRLVPWALVLLSIGYATRITRWLLMLRQDAPGMRWGEAARPLLVSIATNNVLPFRAGDLLRLFAFPNQPGTEPSRVAGTLIVERVLDLLVLLLIFACVLPALPTGTEGEALSRLALPAGLVGVLGLSVLFFMPAVDRFILTPLSKNARVKRWDLGTKVVAVARALADTIAKLNRPSKLAALIALSLLVWLFEGGVIVVAASATGISGGLPAAFLALAVATLSTLLPSSPGYVGTFHFFAFKAAVVFGTPPPVAAAFSIVAHLLLWVPTTLAGAAAAIWSSNPLQSARL